MGMRKESIFKLITKSENMANTIPTQRNRLIILLIYIAVLFVANFLAFDQVLPLSGARGLWFYTGIASVLLGNLLVTPFYTKPVDAISYSVVAGIALYSVHNWSDWHSADKIVFIFALIYCLLVLIFAFITILTKDSTNQIIQKWSNTFKILSDALGNQSAIFSVVILFALIVFHRGSASEMFYLTLAWAITVVIKPDAILIGLWERVKKIWKMSLPATVIGEIAAYQNPGIVLIRQKINESITFGSSVIVRDPHAPSKIGVTLDYVGRDEALLLRAIELEIPTELKNLAIKASSTIPVNTVARFNTSSISPEFDDLVPFFKKLKNFVGIVAPDTSIERLYFEVIQETQLEEGRLVEVLIGEKPIIYQIIDGLTKEEIVHQKNTYGYARAKAQKIGIWDDKETKFVPAKWLPKPNSPVYLITSENIHPVENAVGHFPGTNYTVGIKNTDYLVTHNTAILGILGVGKSMLSIELVERMIANKIKVICIDLTNQYAQELSDFFDSNREEKNLLDLQKIGIGGKSKVAQNVEEGGSIKQFSLQMMNDLEEFLDDDFPYKLKIYNPSQFEAWRQDSKPYKGIASMVSLTPTEITQIISDATLKIVQKLGMTDKARVCLVYEEAHSLVPEWTSVAAEGDKAATNGTARAILQGRKYGLGCLLITQRTANVTKTILNQCNTIFAMRTFDDTGKGFLANYIGGDYADILPSLQERHAIVFGKASTCENPVLIRLNDQEDFRMVFRKKYPPPELPKTSESVTTDSKTNAEDTDIPATSVDDVPF